MLAVINLCDWCMILSVTISGYLRIWVHVVFSTFDQYKINWIPNAQWRDNQVTYKQHRGLLSCIPLKGSPLWNHLLMIGCYICPIFHLKYILSFNFLVNSLDGWLDLSFSFLISRRIFDFALVCHRGTRALITRPVWQPKEYLAIFFGILMRSKMLVLYQCFLRLER